MLKTVFVFCCVACALFAKSMVFVGIAGGTGSGKSTLAERIHDAFPNSVLIHQDSYYRDLSHLSMAERIQTNFDHPHALEFSLLKEHLLALKNGDAIEQPIYNFHRHVREKMTKRVVPAQIILVEGLLLFSDPELRELLDIKIFIDTDDDVRVLRRIERDMKERSRDFKSIKEQYLSTVKPMHDAFIEPSKKYADVIFQEGGLNQVAISLLIAKLYREL